MEPQPVSKRIRQEHVSRLERWFQEEPGGAEWLIERSLCCHCHNCAFLKFLTKVMDQPHKPTPVEKPQTKTTHACTFRLGKGDEKCTCCGDACV